MSIIQAIILGVVQGLTEFLPVSSSGHLIFFPTLFGWTDQGLAFDVVLHLGTLVAVIIFFRKRLLSILRAIFWSSKHNKADRTLAAFLIVSIIPASIIGLAFDAWIETHLRSTIVIAVGFIVWGILLGVADHYATKQQHRTHIETMTWKQVIAMGTAQAIALIPGTSRSGITMTAGLFFGLDKKTAAAFSFLMSVPIIGLAGGVKLIDVAANGMGDIGIMALMAGGIAAAVSGLLAIWGLMRIIERWSFMPFVYYRLALGIFIFLFLV